MRSLVRRGEFRAVVVVVVGTVVGWLAGPCASASVGVGVAFEAWRQLVRKSPSKHPSALLAWANDEQRRDEPSRADESQVGQIMVCQVNLEQQPLQLLPLLPSQQ